MHFVLAASAAHRWANCSGSVLKEAEFPDRETQEALDGTASHWVAETCLRSLGSGELITARSLVGQQDPNGTTVTDEMADGASMYTGEVMRVANEHGASQSIHVESRLLAAMVNELCGGTTDTWLYVPECHRLYIFDYKFGHALVEAEKNWQGIVYYAGIYERLGLNGHTDQTLDVRIIIVQPRAFHRLGPVREWRTTGAELRAYINILHVQAGNAFSNPVCEAGTWCLHCKAAHDCEANAKRAHAAMSYASTLDKANMTPDEVSYELLLLTEAKAAIKERLTAFEAQVESWIESGQHVKGWTFEATKGRRAWTVAPDMVEALGNSFGKELTKKTPLTPRQAISEGVDEEVVKQFSAVNSGAKKLVRTDTTIAFKAFNKRGN